VSITVSQMLPPADQSEISAEHLETFEKAVDCIIAGNWGEGTTLLNSLQGDDGPKDFLFRQMARTDNAVPADWDGAFSLTEK